MKNLAAATSEDLRRTGILADVTQELLKWVKVLECWYLPDQWNEELDKPRRKFTYFDNFAPEEPVSAYDVYLVGPRAIKKLQDHFFINMEACAVHEDCIHDERLGVACVKERAEAGLEELLEKKARE